MTSAAERSHLLFQGQVETSRLRLNGGPKSGYRSFSDNGWVVKDGAQRTHQLLGIFTSKFGRPSRVYAAGGSMGGLIAIKLIETYPGQFAGALLACPRSPQ